MSNTKISALTSATTPLAGTEVLPIVQSSATKQVSVANLTVGRTQTSNGIVQGTAATGYNFTANTPASGMTSQLLNWYEEGTWTPVLTFATPGDLAVTYSQQVGVYTRIGNKVFINFSIFTSAFAFTTSSGALTLTGLPFVSKNLTGDIAIGSMYFSGITQAGYTQFVPGIAANTSKIIFIALASALAAVSVTATNTPTAGTINLRGSIAYDV